MRFFRSSPLAPAVQGGPPRLSLIPDLRGARSRLAASLVVAFVVAVVLVIRFPAGDNYGDTDDAMRLVMVRDLLAGQGWYDQVITRLQPPRGLHMHWSRLLDGGLAGSVMVARLAAPPAMAEWLVRVLWPLAWIIPAVAAALTVARNLGDRSAVFLTAVLLLINLTLYLQFIPGRIDHHNIQIVMVMIALAGATAKSHEIRWAVIAGLAGGLGLGIGLEALVLQALIGGGYALRVLADRRTWAIALAYGLALALACLGVFLIQTPPPQWTSSVCDALAWNSTCAVTVAGFGLAASAVVARRANLAARIGVLTLTFVGALGVYLGLHPACLHGPFADVSPLARRLWLDHVEEAQPLNLALRINRDTAVSACVFLLVSAAAGLFLVLRERRARPAGMLLAGAALVVASLMAVLMWKMVSYAAWIGAPMIGAAYGRLAERRLGGLLLPSVLGTVILSPTVIGAAANATHKSLSADRVQAVSRVRQDACFAPRSYAELAALPPGPVLSEIDLGSFLLLFTPHSALSAPYHRMWPAIMKAHDAFEGPPGLAEARVRSLGAAYLVDCPGLPLMSQAPGLAARLRAGRIPDWLHEVSTPSATLRIYRVAAQPGISSGR
jgi:hypothetical protein